MTDALDRTSLAGIRDTALLVLGFALGARRSELAALDIADLSFTVEGVQVEVRTSKTDRDSHGRTAALPYGAHSVTCPVRTAGLDPKAAWSGHSLRRGFATETYRTGADPLRIARAGGWKDGSATLLGYIDDVDRWQANPLAGVGL